MPRYAKTRSERKKKLSLIILSNILSTRPSTLFCRSGWMPLVVPLTSGSWSRSSNEAVDSHLSPLISCGRKSERMKKDKKESFNICKTRLRYTLIPGQTARKLRCIARNCLLETHIYMKHLPIYLGGAAEMLTEGLES